MISPQRGGRKQRRAASCFRHMLLTLAGFLSGAGSAFLHAPNHGIDIMFAKTQKVEIQYKASQILSGISAADLYLGGRLCIFHL